MGTDTSTIQRVSIPPSLICSFTASMGTSSLWKIPAARAASTSVFSKTSEKCSTFPAPEEAITGRREGRARGEQTGIQRFGSIS